MTDPQGSESSGTETSETPGYTSPTEQFQEAMAKLGLNPAWGFQRLFEAMSGGGKAGAGGGGGSFEFSVAEMRELHRQFSDEADALEEMAKKSDRSSTNLQPLASDEASMKHFDAAQDHYGKLRSAVEQQLTFATGFRDAIGAAIGLKSADEESVASGANKIGRAL